MTSNENTAGVMSAFLYNHRKTVHTLVVLIVFACLLEHLVESLIGWDTFLQTGKDTETLLVFVLLLLGLALTIALRISVFESLIHQQSVLVAVLRTGIGPNSFVVVLAVDTSPPRPLRI